MPSFAAQFAPFAERMRAENLPEVVIRNFEHYYRQLLSGQTGLIAESAIQPVTTLPDADDFADRADYRAAGELALPHTITIKLNGGLGTSMGLARAKGLLPVKDDLTFLDIVARQALAQDVPLLLMNSFNTQSDSLAVLERYPGLEHGLPRDFLQHKVPKVAQETLTPADFPDNPEMEWCPPGHGDIYSALITSGMLDLLLARGYRYAFVANVDNLGAVLDTAILGYFAANGLPFMMEVADRTDGDRKGGHLAQLPNGRLILRESAQCPAADLDHFQNIQRHRYFNTNNLWLHLPALQQMMRRTGNVLGLPMIRNVKTINPRDTQSTPVYQLETAMGSAIAIFDGAGAVRVPRSRFAPVKTTNDLLAVRSDAYILADDYRVLLNLRRELPPPVLDLDRAYYRLIDKMEARFPFGSPSLLQCREMQVRGDIRFGRNITIRGSVALVNHSDHPLTIDHDAVLTGN